MLVSEKQEKNKKTTGDERANRKKPPSEVLSGFLWIRKGI